MVKEAAKSTPCVAYYRVSTRAQGESGLGLEAQQKAVVDYLTAGNLDLLDEFTEVETGKKADRPELERALTLCKKKRATLVIAKLDRLARNVHFISGLMERGVSFCAVDFPSASRFELHIRAALAEEERALISQRTKAGLERAKARGVKLGKHGKVLARENKVAARKRVSELRPVIRQIRKAGKTRVRAIMRELNERGIPAARGGEWRPQTVNVLLRRIDRRAA